MQREVRGDRGVAAAHGLESWGAKASESWRRAAPAAGGDRGGPERLPAALRRSVRRPGRLRRAEERARPDLRRILALSPGAGSIRGPQANCRPATACARGAVPGSCRGPPAGSRASASRGAIAGPRRHPRRRRAGADPAGATPGVATGNGLIPPRPGGACLSTARLQGPLGVGSAQAGLRIAQPGDRAPQAGGLSRGDRAAPRGGGDRDELLRRALQPRPRAQRRPALRRGDRAPADGHRSAEDAPAGPCLPGRRLPEDGRRGGRPRRVRAGPEGEGGLRPGLRRPGAPRRIAGEVGRGRGVLQEGDRREPRLSRSPAAPRRARRPQRRPGRRGLLPHRGARPSARHGLRAQPARPGLRQARALRRGARDRGQGGAHRAEEPRPPDHARPALSPAQLARPGRGRVRAGDRARSGVPGSVRGTRRGSHPAGGFRRRGRRHGPRAREPDPRPAVAVGLPAQARRDPGARDGNGGAPQAPRGGRRESRGLRPPRLPRDRRRPRRGGPSLPGAARGEAGDARRRCAAWRSST